MSLITGPRTPFSQTNLITFLLQRYLQSFLVSFFIFYFNNKNRHEHVFIRVYLGQLKKLQNEQHHFVLNEAHNFLVLEWIDLLKLIFRTEDFLSFPSNYNTFLSYDQVIWFLVSRKPLLP